MVTIVVNLKERAYRIYIGEKIVQELADLLKRNGIRKNDYNIAVVTSFNVIRNCGVIEQILKKYGYHVVRILIEDTEKNKNLKTYYRIIMEINKCETAFKKFCLIAFGGGVITDLTGFVAGTYKRGIPYVCVPTTLLSQVDSAIGGKTGIDLPTGKNLIGVFYQPCFVLNDISFLKTLPVRQIKAGIAEIIKYSIINNGSLFKYIQQRHNELLNVDSRSLIKVITECCKIKAKIVEVDEYDDIEGKKVRAKLNFGHTIGHAIESISRYKNYTHGEAISIGMVCESIISNKMGFLSTYDKEWIKNLIKLYGLPTKISRCNIDKLLYHMGYDKKFSTGKIRFALPMKIGDVKIIEEVPLSVIKESLKDIIV